MSGGHFDYNQRILKDIAVSIQELIENNKNKDEFGYCYNFNKKTIKQFKKTVEMLLKAEIYVQRIDWLVSGDDGEETFHERLEEELKAVKQPQTRA